MQGKRDDILKGRFAAAFSIRVALYRLAAGRALGVRPEDVEAHVFSTALGASFAVDARSEALGAAERRAGEALDAIEADAASGGFGGRARDDPGRAWACERCAWRGVAGCEDLAPAAGAEAELEEEGEGDGGEDGQG